MKKLALPPFVVLKQGDWYVKISFPTTETYPDGRRKYIQVKKRCLPETAERADALVNEIKAAYAAIRDPAPASVETVDDLRVRFLEAKKGTVTRTTHDYYTNLLGGSVKGSALARLPISTVTVLDVQSFYDSMLKNGRSATYVRKVHVLLSMLFNRAIVWGLIGRSPTIGVLLPAATAPDVHALDREQARQLVAACRTDPKYFIFEFALDSAMRPSEYLALRWSDIDLERRRVKVVRAVAANFNGGGREIKQTKTLRGRRTITIGSAARDGLRRHKAAQDIFLESDGLQGHSRRKRRVIQDDLVFPAPLGGYQSPKNLTNRVFAPLLEKAGLDKLGFTLYSLRHTWISLALAAGGNIKSISQRAGHSSVSFTLQTYAHVFDSTERETADLVSAEIFD